MYRPNHIFRNTLLAAGLAVLAACSRQELAPERGLEVRVETVGLHMEGEPDTRASLNGLTGAVSLVTGDQIAVHTNIAGGSYKTCTVDATDVANIHATIAMTEGEERDGYAVYPAEAASGNGSPTMQVIYATSYDLSGYAESALPTLTDARMPMVAVNAPESALDFYHVGGVIRIVLEAVPAGTKTIVVTVSGDAVTGTATVTEPGTATATSSITSGGNTVTFILPGENGLTEERTVVLHLPVPCGTYTGLQIQAYNATGSSVLVSCYDDLTCLIAHARGSRYIHSFNETTFSFSVGRNKRVAIARGNLMAKIGSITVSSGDDVYATASEWKFGEPTEYIGDASNGGNYQFITKNSACVGKWVDFFSWQGASSTNDATHRRHGLIRARYYGKNPDYFGTVLGESTYDGCWDGLYISNGGGYNTWRPLSIDEWDYLFNTRPSANSRFGLAIVKNVNGLILLPDSFSDPNKSEGYDAFTPGVTEEWAINVYDDSGWAAMEAAGAVFLPAAGEIGNSSGAYWYPGELGYYWSNTSTQYTTVTSLIFGPSNRMGNNNIVVIDKNYGSQRERGFSVRLARDID